MFKYLNKLIQTNIFLPIIVFIISLWIFVIIWLGKSTLYFIASANQYLIFHNIAEFFSIAASLSIFGIGWYSYDQSKNKHALFLSATFFITALIDLMHLLSYPGMPDFFTLNTTNKSSQLWVAARMFSAVTLLGSALIYSNSATKWLSKITAICGIVITITLIIIGFFYYPQYIPATFIEGIGLTPFKIYSEYIIVILFITSLLAYWKRFTKSKEPFYVYLITGLTTSIFSEIAFTLYRNAFDTYNTLGHIYKVIAFLFIYQSLFKSSVETPYTEIKEKDKELQYSKEKYAKAFQYAPYAISISRAKDGVFFEINDKFCKLLGYTKEEVLQTSALQMKLWVNVKDRQEVVESLTNGNPVIDKEYLFRKKNGEVNTGLFSAQYIMLGHEKCILSTTMDISDIKKDKELILKLNEQNKAILSSIGDGVLACDTTGMLILCNKRAVELTGFPVEKAIGQKYDTILSFTSETNDKIKYDIIHDSIKNNKTVELPQDALLITKSKGNLPVAGLVSPIKDSIGNITGAVIVIRDMAKERNINKTKSEIISLASHQLRTPLTALRWASEILNSGTQGQLNTEQQKYVEKINNTSKRMLSLVNSILNVSRLELNTFTVQPQLIDPTDIANICINDLTTQFTQKEITLTKFYETGSILIQADPKLLSIIINNLLTNAVKYTPSKGQIKLTISKKDDDLIIIVADTGIGIPENQIEQIFTKMYRADNARALDPEGTGLGLYIIKEIANHTGGKITVESQENKGSIFTFTLPLTGMVAKEGFCELS